MELMEGDKHTYAVAKIEYVDVVLMMVHDNIPLIWN